MIIGIVAFSGSTLLALLIAVFAFLSVEFENVGWSDIIGSDVADTLRTIFAIVSWLLTILSISIIMELPSWLA